MGKSFRYNPDEDYGRDHKSLRKEKRRLKRAEKQLRRERDRFEQIDRLADPEVEV